MIENVRAADEGCQRPDRNEGTATIEVQVPLSKKAEAVAGAPVYTVESGCTAPEEAPAMAGTDASAPALQAEVPSTYALAPNYPNPFNPATEIAFDLPERAHVRLAVYDVTGRRVALLRDGAMPAGTHRVTFDARGLPGGVYLYRITAGSFTRTRQMVWMK